MDFLKAVRILRVRKWTVLSVAVVAFALIAAAPKPQVDVIPFYTSKSKLLITPPSSSVRAFGGQTLQASADFSWFADPSVLTELLRSEELLTRVIQSSDADITKEELGYSVSVENLSERNYGGHVRLFSLSVQNKDPKEAQKLTRLLTEEFVRYVEDLSAREFANTRRFVEELVLEAQGQRDNAEMALDEIREKYLDSPSDEALIMQARTLEGRINETERSVAALKVEVGALGNFRSGQTDSPPWQVVTASNGSLAQLDANVADKRLELVKVADVYTETNENVVRAKRELATAEKLYETALDQTVESLYKTKAGELQQSQIQRTSLVSELNSLLRSRMTDEDRRLVSKFERELDVWERNYLNLQQQLYQARVVEQSSRRQGSVNVLEQPSIGIVAFDPNAPQMAARGMSKKKLAMAIPFCLILGIAVALLKEYLTSSTKLRPRVEEALEMPVIAVIPSSRSDITVDWEGFKRPDKEKLAKMELASTRAPGLENAVPVSARATNTSFADRGKKNQKEPGGGSFGSHARFRNQK